MTVQTTIYYSYGEVAEWLKAHAWKACVRATVPRVRISSSPPIKNNDQRGRYFLYISVDWTANETNN